MSMDRSNKSKSLNNYSPAPSEAGNKKRLLFDEDEQDDLNAMKVNKKFAKAYNDKNAQQEFIQLSKKYAEENQREADSSSFDEEEEDETGEKADLIGDDILTFLPMLASGKKHVLVDEASTLKPGREVRSDLLERLKEGVITIAERERRAKQDLIKEAQSTNFDDFEFKKKKKSAEELSEEARRLEQINPAAKDPKTPDDIISDYWGSKNLSNDDKFLRNFILQKGWLGEGDAIEMEEDEEGEIERAAEFEHNYNFRYEEPGAMTIPTFERFPKDSLRKPSERQEKKRKRLDAKKVKKQQEDEEKKRLMNVKKRDIIDKLNQLKRDSGTKRDIAELDLSQALYSDFDPAQHDAMMEKMFGEEYYDEEEGNLEKPSFSGEDEYDDEWDKPTFQEEAEEDFETIGYKGNLVDIIMEQKKKGVRTEDLEKDLEDYYNLDYESKIGDMPVRFKYTNVEANAYGLEVVDILNFSDNVLHKLVPRRNLQPYRDDQGRFEVNPKKSIDHLKWEAVEKQKKKEEKIMKKKLKKKKKLKEQERLKKKEEKDRKRAL